MKVVAVLSPPPIGHFNLIILKYQGNFDHLCDAGDARFFESLTATMKTSEVSSSSPNSNGIFSMALAGTGGVIVGALLTMVMARMIRGGRVQQEPLLG